MGFTSLLWIFFVAGFVGVVLETIYCSVWVRRGALELRFGILYVPVNPMYGGAAVILTVLLTPLASSPILVVVAGLVLCSAIEYAVSVWLERAFGLVFWDYHGKFLNLHGRICLESALVWGGLSLLLIGFINPATLALASMVPRSVGDAVLIVLVVATAAGAMITIAAFRRIKRRITAWERSGTGYRTDIPETAADRLIHRLAPDRAIALYFAFASLPARYLELAKAHPG
jgi:uncharacterized membrane protein